MTFEISDTTLAYGEDATTALLGLDALFRAEPDHDDALVVLNMSKTHQPERFADYTEAKARFAELEQRAADLPEPDRRRYYQQLCQSEIAFCDWRMGQLPFASQVSGFLHVPAAPASEAELNALRTDMRALLNGMGYSGDLSAQCTAWQDRNRVPADEVPDTLTELLDEAWDRTVERMEIPAPKSDGMRVQGVSGVPYSGRCDYAHRMIDLNIDPIYTRPGLKHLAVHEGYPGHYVQFKLRETLYHNGTAPADNLLSVVNTASSSPFEGIADNGLRVIDWIESDDDRLSALLTRYRSGIGTVAAWQLHVEKRAPEQVADWLRANGLVGGEGWVANRMRFITASDRSALIWSYWWGEASVAPVWESVAPDRRAEFLHYLYGRMHSPQTIAMFA
ncbi:MAG TPA: hypothetical protein VFT66_10065 [Roseiflexaceae bacterium]|nr:hypothetical protein [Roseiflexaceae bacterium]